MNTFIKHEHYKEKRNYPFSSIASNFKSHLLSIRFHSTECASVLLTEREGVVKLMYWNTAPFMDITVAKAILHYVYSLGAKEFVTFDARLVSILHFLRIPFSYKHETRYQYVWGKNIGNLSVNDFDYGDGDAIFT